MSFGGKDEGVGGGGGGRIPNTSHNTRTKESIHLLPLHPEALVRTPPLPTNTIVYIFLTQTEVVISPYPGLCYVSLLQHGVHFLLRDLPLSLFDQLETS